MIILHEGAIFLAMTLCVPLSMLVLHFCYWIGMVEARNNPTEQEKVKHNVKWIAIVYSTVVAILDSMVHGYTFTRL